MTMMRKTSKVRKTENMPKMNRGSRTRSWEGGRGTKDSTEAEGKQHNEEGGSG